MEKRLVRGAIHSFLIGLALAIIFIFIPQEMMVRHGGAYTSYMTPLDEYLFQLLRFSVKFSLAATVALWIRELYLKSEMTASMTDLKNGFLIDFVIFIVVLLLIGLIRGFVN